MRAHVEVCPDNPDARPRKKAKPAPRGSVQKTQSNAMEMQLPGSDNGLKPYLLLDANDAKTLPRLDPESPVVYRGELYCRHPGCTAVHRYATAAKLRRHYKDSHELLYNVFRTGVLSPHAQLQHDRGLEWLARCVALGEETAGEPPPRPNVW